MLYNVCNYLEYCLYCTLLCCGLVLPLSIVVIQKGVFILFTDINTKIHEETDASYNTNIL